MEYDFEKLSKEIVIDRLKGVDDPYALAAEAVRKILVPAIAGTRSQQEPRVTIAAACRGIMSGMLLIEKDLPKTAVALLTQMTYVANETHLDPSDCMTWAMEGIAPVAKMAHGEVADSIGYAIEENFMGAREVFNEILRTAGA